MGIKATAIAEMDALMKEFDISPSRIGRYLFNNPNFYSKLLEPETKVTDVTLDRIFAYAAELRGQLKLPFDD
tara:strand:+ start:181 stop:396 length:216 start_codon:yes stop_codon:yes gene_type:complete